MLLLFFSSIFAQDILIQNARLIDARGDMGIHSILISDQIIQAIDPQELPPSIRTIDASNHSVLPGLIDSHVHITMAPGEAYRNETPEERSIRHAHHMRAFLAMGVTTIVDPGISIQHATIVRQLQATTPSPNIFFIGPLLGPHEGYPSNVVSELPGVSDLEEIQARIDEFASFAPLGIKVTMEDGPLMSTLPLFSPDLQSQIQREAKKRNQPLYIHATDVKSVSLALDMKPHALVHSPHKYNKKLVQRIIEQDVYVCSTIDIFAISLEYWNPNYLSNPTFRKVVPADELDALTDPKIRRDFVDEGWKANAPGWPLWIGRLLFQKWIVNMYVNEGFKMFRALHQAGAKIVLGSDSSGWPLIPYLLHGPSTHYEIDLLHHAGLSPQEIITAGTQTPAKMLGIEDRVGSLEIGKTADLLIVEGNPLENLATIHQPVWVMRAGRIQKAEDWLTVEKTSK